MKALIPLMMGLFTMAAQAATPNAILAGYSDEAARQNPRFQTSPELGEHLYTRRFKTSVEMPSCRSCHGDDPSLGGSHVLTGEAIRPLAPVANAERFRDPAKVEKWFSRDCSEVIGRECSAAEKADFIAFVMQVR